MNNRNLQIGYDFTQKSLYDSPSLQHGRQEWHPQEQIPLPFKVYRQTKHYPLHQVPPLTLGDPRRAFEQEEEMDGVAGASPAPVRTPTISYESLSTLLYYTYGFSRHDEGAEVAWPYHRLVASARCLFPTELYLWLPQTEQISAGVYHYDSLHHRLALIREGEYRDLLATALDTELDTCLGVLLVSAHFWKTAFKYINFAYRLCTQEAGIVTGNALIVAGTLGYAGRVHYQFLDQPLNRLLGFVPDEESLLAVVPLYAVAHNPPPSLRRLEARTTGQSLSETLAPIALDYVKTTTFDRQLCAILTAMDQHTFLAQTSEMVTANDALLGLACLTTEERIAPPAPSPAGIDLAEALHFRSSGDMNFHSLQVPLDLEAFWEIVRYSLTAYNSDLQYATSSPYLQLYIVVQHVSGIEPGIYRLCADCGMLHVIERGDFVSRVQVLQMVPNVASASANLVCFLAGDYATLSHLFGNRAYRMMNLEAGLIAQRISVMSAALGFTARYSNSYIQPLTKMMLKLKETSIEPLAELIIGYEQPGVQAGGRRRFSVLR
jgi:SagB-type dehydrogenase family enzyme